MNRASTWKNRGESFMMTHAPVPPAPPGLRLSGRASGIRWPLLAAIVWAGLAPAVGGAHAQSVVTLDEPDMLDRVRSIVIPTSEPGATRAIVLENGGIVGTIPPPGAVADGPPAQSNGVRVTNGPSLKQSQSMQWRLPPSALAIPADGGFMMTPVPVSTSSAVWFGGLTAWNPACPSFAGPAPIARLPPLRPTSAPIAMIESLRAAQLAQRQNRHQR